MSEMEYWKGEVTPIKIPEGFKSFKDIIEYLQGLGHTFSGLELEQEWFFTKGSTCFCLDDIWYDRRNLIKFNPDNLSIVNKKENGNIDIMVSFYNGGGSLEEAISDAYKEGE